MSDRSESALDRHFADQCADDCPWCASDRYRRSVGLTPYRELPPFDKAATGQKERGSDA